jgi:hypothetical protein
MANWYGAARSSYFTVEDEEAFRAWAKKRGLSLFEKTEPVKMFAITPNNEITDSGGWPWIENSTDDEEDNTFSISEELSKFLQEGQVAILMEVGAEKLRYVTGVATAVDSTGKEITINLDLIYKLAAKKFKVPIAKISECVY